MAGVQVNLAQKMQVNPMVSEDDGTSEEQLQLQRDKVTLLEGLLKAKKGRESQDG